MFMRAVTTALCLTVMSVLVPAWSAPAEGAVPRDATLVQVEPGRLRGTAAGDTVSFRGVPYAAPPVGPLRWQAPRPPRPWKGVRDATAPADRCPQASPDPQAPVAGSEDCLYLNVTRPARPSRPGPMPVIVWTHGGGLTSGAGSEYDAARLVTAGDAVVVTVNYRLGALGFLSHPALDAEDAVSGNYGLQDQAEALRWVRRNVAAFGGDPGQVTLAGQSAGARSVCTHLAAPGSRGLFQRAIVQSGACANRVMTKPAADAKGIRAAREVGCAGTADVRGCLRDVPVADLLEASAGVGTSVTRTAADDAWGPVAGTPYLPRQPSTAIRRGSAAGIPLLLGSTHDEMRSFVPSQYDLGGNPLTTEGYATVIEETFGTDAEDVLDLYPAADYPSPVLALSTVLTDWGGWIGSCPTLATARAASRHAPVYAYELTQSSGEVVDGFPYGANHGSDLPYLFDLPWAEPAPAKLSATMVGYWTTFARAGDPNRAGLPKWRQFGAGGDVLGLADAHIGPTPFAPDHRCRFWAHR